MLKHSVVPQHRGWFSFAGDNYDVVVGSAVRLARNLEDLPFSDLLSSSDDQITVRRRVEQVFSALPEEYLCVDGEAVRPAVAQFYRDRGILGSGLQNAFSIITNDEQLQVQIGGEDHLLLTALRGGLAHHDALKQVRRLDQLLEEQLSWAVSLRLGYLSPRLDTVGTGLTAEAIVFLPVLHQGNAIADAEGIRRDRVDIRPYGNGSSQYSALYLLQCRASFPEREEETIALLEESVERLVHYERDARRTLMQDHPVEFSDAVHRALGTLKHARTLSAEEAVEHAAMVRLGAACGVIENPDCSGATDLLFAAEDSSVVVFCSKDDENIDMRRADLMRMLLGESGTR